MLSSNEESDTESQDYCFKCIIRKPTTVDTLCILGYAHI